MPHNKDGQKAQGYYRDQLTGVFDMRFLVVLNNKCTDLEPPVVEVLLFAKPNDPYHGIAKNFTMSLIPGYEETKGEYSY